MPSKSPHSISDILVELKKQPSYTISGLLQYDTRYTLALLTSQTVNDPHIIRCLATWRKNALQFLPSTRPITIKGTREWLQKSVIEGKDRALFMITIQEKYIGHVGLYRYNEKNRSIGIDNIVRGEKGYPGIMQAAIGTMMTWGKETLGIQTYTVTTSDDNIKAIQLYTRLGFTEVSRRPLYRTKTQGGERFDIGEVGHTSPINRYSVQLAI